MTHIEALAEVYSIPPDDVATWPVPVLNVLHRNAIHRGWLLNDYDKESA